MIELVAEGATLKSALETVELNVNTFYRTVSSVRDLGVDYARAREFRSDLDVDEAVAIADDESIDPQRARNMIDIRKWRASKHNAKVYGDRIDLNVNQQISIGDALAEARSRVLRPMRDLAPIVDAEVVDMPALPTSGATDSVSDSASGPAQPSIFD